MPPDRRAVPILLACCALWGLSFPLMKLIGAGLDQVPGSPSDLAVSAGFNALRFATATLLMVLLAPRLLGQSTWTEIRGGAVVGGCFGLGIWLQMAGLSTVSPPVSAFLTALTVVLVPLGQVVVLKRPLEGGLYLGVPLAIAGALVLTIGTESTAQPGPWPYFGETLTLLGVVAFSACILAIDREGGRSQPWRLGIWTFATSAVVNLLIGLGLGITMVPGWGLGPLASSTPLLAACAALVALCSVLAFALMLRWQPAVSPAVAAVIYASEPVWATAWSPLFGFDGPGWETYAGGALVLAACAVVARGSRSG